jgi:hypothetical protein
MMQDLMNNDKEFARCLPFIFESEGDYVNDPKDPGGETKYGISKKAWPNLDIKNLTKEEAAVIYYKHYWLFVADQLPWPLNLCVFDTAVNQGTKKARQFLKEAGSDWKKYLEIRRIWYLSLIHVKPELDRFRKGWLNRINNIKKYVEEKAP